MINSREQNVYQPKMAVMEDIREEIQDVKTFYWRFENPEDQKAFKTFMPGQFAQGRPQVVRRLPGIRRVPANHGEHVRELLRKLDCPLAALEVGGHRTHRRRQQAAPSGRRRCRTEREADTR